MTNLEQGTLKEDGPGTRRPAAAFCVEGSSSFGLLRFLPVLLLLFAACDDGFDPSADSEDAGFAVFGVLDTAADTQVVRVSPVRRTVEGEPEEGEAEVQSLVLGTGAAVRWVGRAVRAADGTTALLFSTPQRLEPGDAVRLDVQRPGGEAVTRAFTRIPERARAEAEPPRQTFDQRFILPVTLFGLPQPPHRVDAVYRLYAPEAPEDTLTVFISFLNVFRSSGGWATQVNLQGDRPLVMQRLGRDPRDTTLTLVDVGLRVELRSDEWRLPETPEPPPNIENGFGFFASTARYLETWPLDPEVASILGYRTDE